MAAVVILVAAVDQFSAPLGQYRLAGVAEVEGSGMNAPVSWETFVAFSDAVSVVNKACVDAAVAAVQTAGFTVAPADKKTLFASAV